MLLQQQISEQTEDPFTRNGWLFLKPTIARGFAYDSILQYSIADAYPPW